MDFATEIEEYARQLGEKPLVVVIGEFGWGIMEDEQNNPVGDMKNKAMPWDVMRQFLEYEYDSGYGGPECHAISVYTENYVIFVSQYDGATGLYSIPRNPINHSPIMPGG